MTTTPDTPRDHHFMELALDEARAAALENDEVPVGAVLVRDDAVLARGRNRTKHGADPTGHAEIAALREAAAREGAARLPGSVLYVTLEPCLMCLGAVIHARVARVVYGATDPKIGATKLLETIPVGFYGLNHTVALTGGVMAEESAALLRSFFRARR